MKYLLTIALARTPDLCTMMPQRALGLDLSSVFGTIARIPVFVATGFICIEMLEFDIYRFHPRPPPQFCDYTGHPRPVSWLQAEHVYRITS